MNLKLIGLGSADAVSMSAAAQRAVSDAEYIIGARRLVDALESRAKTQYAVRTEEIIEHIKSSCAENICVVFSGDTGFYSGAGKLAEALTREGIEFELLPGISSVQLLSRALREPWQDWNLVSAHGESCDILSEVTKGKKTFLLTSGSKSPSALCTELNAHGLGALRVTVGENLGTGDERIVCGTAEEFMTREFAALNVMLCEAAPILSRRAPGIADGEFIRGGVPMTKQEVRAAIPGKLKLSERDICWDVGAGTGSVSVELALNARRVYAVEERDEACALIRQNREKFCAWRMTLIEGRAPDALSSLPAPDAVFIGGSGGELESIINAALEKNPNVRLCVSAIALETLSEAARLMEKNGLEYEVCQIAVSRTKAAGNLHLLMAQNPVFLISGQKKQTF